ncbi:ABC transporter permease [Streptosporangium sp. NPDC004631]
MTALRFIARRLGALLLLLVIVSFVVFSLLSLAPGSLEQTLLGPTGMTDPASVEAIREKYHLDDSFLERYLHWAAAALRLDFGRSVHSGQPVMDVIVQRLPITAQLGLLTLLLVIAFGLPAGMISAIRRGRFADRLISSVSIVATSAPAFAVAVILIYVFGVQLAWFPPFGTGSGLVDRLHHLALPAVALAVGQFAFMTRQTRAAAMDVVDQDFVVFARGRGLSRSQVLFGYQIRNAALPVIASVGLLLIVSLSGTVLVETAFSLPGVGSLMIDSVSSDDIPVVQGLTLLAAAMVVVVNLLADLAMLALDPRIRMEGKG